MKEVFNFESPKSSEIIDLKDLERIDRKVLISPDHLRDIIKKLKQEIILGEKIFIKSGKVSEEELMKKEDLIRAAEIKIVEMDKIKGELGEKEFETIINQEIFIEKQLDPNDIDLVPEVRGKIHSWNIADSKDYFFNPSQIKEAVRQCRDEKLDKPKDEKVDFEVPFITEDLGAEPKEDLGAEPKEDLGAEPKEDLGAEPREDLELEKEKAEKKEKIKSGYWSRIAKRLGLYLALATSLIIVGERNHESVKDVDQDKKENKIQNPRITENTKEKESYFKNLDFRWSFFKKNNDGEVVFNWYSLLAPAQIEKVNNVPVEQDVNMDIPNHYARLFSASPEGGQPINSEDYPDLSKFINGELENKFTEVLVGFDFNKDTYKKDNDVDFSSVSITKIESIGFASPEGRDPESLLRDDPDNQDLAVFRGETGLNLVEENLKDLGLNIDPSADKRFDGKKDKFSEEEWLVLDGLAMAYPGTSSLERIFSMIKDYNSGEIKDSSVTEKINEIINNKRRVEVSIKMEGQKEKRIFIPLPLLLPLLFLLPRLRFPKKDYRKKPSKPPVEMPGGGGDINIEDPAVDPIPVTQDEPKITMTRDLYVYFDHEKTIERGVDYRAICDDLVKKYNNKSFEVDNDRIRFLTMEILKSWEKHDKSCRFEAGEVTNDLDYKKDPRQVMWARVHAACLLEVVKESRKEDKDYREIINKMTALYNQQEEMGSTALFECAELNQKLIDRFNSKK